MSPLVYALATCLILLLIGIPGFLILRVLLVRRLREKHQALWESLGAPTSVDAFFGTNFGALLQWMRQGNYSRLDDRATVRIAVACRATLLVVFSAGCIGLTLALAHKYKVW